MSSREQVDVGIRIGPPPVGESYLSIDRILDAVDTILAEDTGSMRIADVARALGVTRQTVYRYFATADDLMRAAGIASVDGFLDELTECVRGIHDPADAMTEG